MNVTLRLYKRHDLDLIPIIRNKEFKLTVQMKNAIRAYMTGSPFEIPAPESVSIREERSVYLLHFSIHREKEADIFAFVTNIKYGKRNGALKNLLRFYLNTVRMDEYFVDKSFLKSPIRPQSSSIPVKEEALKIPKSDKQKEKKVSTKAPTIPRKGKEDSPSITKKYSYPVEKNQEEAGTTEEDFDFAKAMEGLMGSI